MAAPAGGSASEHAPTVLASPVRRDLLDALVNLPRVPDGTANPVRTRGLTAAELGERLGLHVTTVRFHLEQLVAAGLVVGHDERGHVGRPKRRFTASPGPLPTLRRTEPFAMLAELLVDVLEDGSVHTAEQAGRRWLERHSDAIIATSTTSAQTRSEWLAKMGVLIDVLDDWGYAPEVTTVNSGHTAELQLHNCPLRHLVDSNPDVACGVHRGIIQATLEAMGEGDAEMKLLPLVTPHLCLARITTSNDLTQRSRTRPTADQPIANAPA